ncbi:MAG: acylneuraminate cytidylyltransferase family protein [Oligoflexales bacterium]
MEHNILGVIPARGGSKGIPDKNIYPLCGKPLIAYTIESAKKSKLFSDLIVSTDSEQIAEIASKWGIDIPFIRPSQFATDTAHAVDVMKHALYEMEGQSGKTYEFIAMLQPTTPLKDVEDIDACLKKIIETGCDSVVSLVDVGANHPARMYTVNKKEQLVSIFDEGVAMKPRQELPPVYIRSGAVYVTKRNILLEHNSLIGKDCRAYIVPQSRSVNIDEYQDIVLAEYYVNEKLKRHNHV